MKGKLDSLHQGAKNFLISVRNYALTAATQLTLGFKLVEKEQEMELASERCARNDPECPPRRDNIFEFASGRHKYMAKEARRSLNTTFPYLMIVAHRE